jgi:hypothetical protein
MKRDLVNLRRKAAKRYSELLFIIYQLLFHLLFKLDSAGCHITHNALSLNNDQKLKCKAQIAENCKHKLLRLFNNKAKL